MSMRGFEDQLWAERQGLTPADRAAYPAFEADVQPQTHYLGTSRADGFLRDVIKPTDRISPEPEPQT